jgi:hypothetical protein
MAAEELRDKLHKYIDVAEERKIEAIYTMLEEDIASYNYVALDIQAFHERRNKHLKGESGSYSVEESLER